MIARAASRAAAAIAALLLVACSDPPGEADMRRAVENLQQEWAQQQRVQRQQGASGPRIAPDLSFEAMLALRITALRRLSCREAPEISGWNCTFEITASLAGQSSVTRLMQGQFTNGVSGWVARNVGPAPARQ